MLRYLFTSLFLFLSALTSAAVDVREMSIDEYINFVNPPPVYKYQTKFGDTMLCVKFSDQISVKYAHDNITRGLKKPPKLKSSILNISNIDTGGVNISKLGFKSECPEDTVAIREIKREDVERAGSVREFLKRRRRKPHITPNDVNDGPREHAIVSFQTDDDEINEVTARFNVWKPEVASDADFSLSQFWISNNGEGRDEVIEVGWMVYPSRYGDKEPRLFIYWTPDNYLTGCYDEDCPGYVSYPDSLASPGLSILDPVSKFGQGTQFEIVLSLVHEAIDEVGFVWMLFFENQPMGYWPASLFKRLSQHANRFDVGGEVAYLRRTPGMPLTRTEMGSGRFPWRGFGYAAFTRAIRMYGYDGNAIREIHLDPQLFATKPECYYVLYTDSDTLEWGKHIFFGGPGGDYPQCVG